MAQSKLLQSFYASKLWRNLRLSLIMERGSICAHCGKVIVNPEEIIGHHTIELDDTNVLDHSISLNPELIELVCFDCHNKIDGHFLNQSKPKPRGIYLVYGPPLAGKERYVREHMSPGDIVVDMDSLFEAISYQPRYVKPDKLLSNVYDMQRLLIDHIKTRHGNWRSAWIIGGYADKYKRDLVTKETGAEPVFIECTREACLMRLDAIRDDRSKSKSEWRGYIDKWFETYQP